MTGTIGLAWRQLRNQLRTTEWRALLLACWIAIAIATPLALLADRLERGLLQESAALLGADLILRAQRPIHQERISDAEAAGLSMTQVIQFPSMLARDDEMMLVSVRAARAPYPLRGQIITSPEQADDLPAPGQIWAEQRVFTQLGLSLGDNLQLGYADFEITAVLQSSPDRGSGFRSFSPHVIINEEDLEASGILAPGSRAEFRLLLAGDEDAIETLDEKWRQDLRTDERLYSLQNDQPMTGAALGNGLRYLKLTALIALLLAALTITLSLRRFSNGQFSRCALLLSLGMPPRQLIRLYLLQLLMAWAIVALLGTATGLLLEQLVIGWLEDLLPQALPAAAPLRYFSGAALGLALLVLLGLPPILQLARVPVSHLFRGDGAPQDKRASLLYLTCLILLGVVLLAFLEEYMAALALLVLLLAGGALFGWVTQQALLLLTRPLAKRLLLGRLLSMRLRQQRRWHRLQSAVLVLLLTLLSVVWISRTDLLESWQEQLPVDTPNYFVVNIQPWQKDDLDDFFATHEIDSLLYPMVRGRINSLNGEPIRPQMNEEQLEHNTLNRELNLSWAAQAPDNNPLTAGTWWSSDTTEAEVSVEQEMADELGLSLGDTLGFDIGGLPLEARITNLRQVEWGSFQPNFYVIFNQGALESFPATFITSFHLESEKQQLVNDMLRAFPSLTLIDIDQLLQQAALWLKRLGDSSALILAMSLICGGLLLIVTLLQALEQRRYEVALLQTLGATAKQTRQLDLLEFLLLGLVGGLLASLATELTLGALHLTLLKIPVQLHWQLWVVLPLGAALFFCLSGIIMRRPLLLEQCYRLLRSAT
ncbi:ABC transporter permease [Nitrincola sp. MINF-07-Sa-05]|uniref:ABC transporter permease n=1 Tax=Nitrincola salilacus TaxID=3400273 RepID=UPI003917CD67